jgi:hypothetical protein
VYVPRKLVVAILLLLVGAASLALALSASASRTTHPNARPVFRSSLSPCIAGGPTIHGVGACLDSWSLDQGSVRLGENGDLMLKVKGLVVAATNTASPVTGISAALFCGPDTNTTPAATTDFVPISTDGDALINTTVVLPSTCVAPIIVVNFAKGATLITTRYIALTGFTT